MPCTFTDLFQYGSAGADQRSALLVGCLNIVPYFFGSIVSGFLALLVFDYYRTKDPSFPHSIAIKQYLIFRSLYAYGFYINMKLNKVTRDISRSQDQALREILQVNKTSEYSKQFQLDRLNDRKQFRKVHPLCKYEHFGKYIDRTADGETNIITTADPIFYGTTSGTAGKAKLIPLTKPMTVNFLQFISFMRYKMYPVVPEIAGLSRRMKLHYNPTRNLEKTRSGVDIGPISACTKLFKLGPIYTSPEAAFELLHEDACRYVHVLFGLLHKDLKVIEALFVPIVYYAFEEIEKNWRSLVMDVRHGTLTGRQDLAIPDDIRQKLQACLKPNPERATELERIFVSGFDDIALQIWPKLQMITCIKGGPFAGYEKLLKNKYTGGVLIYDPHYAATETGIACNLWPTANPPRYMLWPMRTFMEFIPAEHVLEEQPNTLFMDQVEKGQDYELVLTTVGGLTRYRFGDVVKVVSFLNQLPVVEFQYRTGHLLNIRGEKVPETCLTTALMNAVSQTPSIKNVQEYCFCSSVLLVNEPLYNTLPHYIFFAEVNLDVTLQPCSQTFLCELSQKVDQQLLELSSRFKYYRDKGALGPVRVYLVHQGAFSELRRFMLANSSASPNQVKIPKVLLKEELARFIFGRANH